MRHWLLNGGRRAYCFCFSWQVGKVTLHTKCASSKGGLHRYHPLVFRQPHLCVLDITLHMVGVVLFARRRSGPLLERIERRNIYMGASTKQDPVCRLAIV